MVIIRELILFSNIFFLGYLIVYATYILISSLYGSIYMIRQRRKEMLHNVLEHDFYFPVSIIIPAYNESISVVQTVENLLCQDYRNFEIVVVDDGSTDDTKQLLIDRFKMKYEAERPIRYVVPCKPINEIYTRTINGITITLISKENGGCKADATNAGINASFYPYIVNMDADEILQRDALKYAGRAILEDDNVIAVGGNIKMSNDVRFENAMPIDVSYGKNMIVDMQVLEYGRAFVGTRIFQNMLNMNLIISGGFGIFKKSAVVEVGGFDTNSMGEDMEITVRLHEYYKKNKIPYSMKYVPESVCWTQGPNCFRDLKKQRQRWYCGLIQTLKKYKRMIFNPRYGMIGMFMFPYIIMYELMMPFFTLLGVFVMGWTYYDKSINLPYAITITVMYFLFCVFLSYISFMTKEFVYGEELDKKKMYRMIFVSLVDSLFFRMYLSFVSFLALFKMKKLAGKWESPQRVVVQTENTE